MSVTTPDILAPEFAEDPYQLYPLFRDEFPLLKHETVGAYIVSRYADVARVLGEPVFSARTYGDQMGPVVGGRVILELEGKEHTAHRRLISPGVQGAGLAHHLPMIERVQRDLIAAFLDRGEVDLVSEFGDLFAIHIVVHLLGLPEQDLPQIREWYLSNVRFAGNVSGDPKVIEEALQSGKEFQAYLREQMEVRRAALGNDLLSALLTAEFGGERMSDTEIVAFCGLLLTAGGETAGKVLTNLFRHLLDNPQYLDEVRADRSLVDDAVAETMRLTPANVILQRLALEDVEMSNGEVIPKDSTIWVLVGAANRDPRQFRDPDRFDLHRQDLAFSRAFAAGANHVAFGAGRHFCVGAQLAKAMLNTGVNLLLDSMHDIRYRDGFVPREAGVVTRGLESLELEFTPAAG